MTILKKCRSCRLDGDCEAQDKVRDAVQGLGIYSLLHRCATHEARYRPGQAVWAFVMDAPYSEYGDGPGEPCRAWFPGHFIAVARNNTRGLVMIAEGAEPREQPDEAYDELSFSPGKNGVCKVAWKRIEPRDAPDVDACSRCGNLNTMPCDYGHDGDCPRQGIGAAMERGAA